MTVSEAGLKWCRSGYQLVFTHKKYTFAFFVSLNCKLGGTVLILNAMLILSMMCVVKKALKESIKARITSKKILQFLFSLPWWINYKTIKHQLT